MTATNPFGFVAEGGNDSFGDLATGRSGNASVVDGDVVGVDAQQLRRGIAVCRDRFQAWAIADGFAVSDSSSTMITRGLP
jgi:hypothetical protein